MRSSLIQHFRFFYPSVRFQFFPWSASTLHIFFFAKCLLFNWCVVSSYCKREGCNWMSEPTESVLGSIFFLLLLLLWYRAFYSFAIIFFCEAHKRFHPFECAHESTLSFIYINLFVVYLIFNEFQSARVHVHILFGAKTEQRRARAKVAKKRKKTAQVIWVYGLVFAMKQIYGHFLFCVRNKKKCWLHYEYVTNEYGWKRRREDVWVCLCSHV